MRFSRNVDFRETVLPQSRRRWEVQERRVLCPSPGIRGSTAALGISVGVPNGRDKLFAVTGSSIGTEPEITLLALEAT
jgi:hypothetical protein